MREMMGLGGGMPPAQSNPEMMQPDPVATAAAQESVFGAEPAGEEEQRLYNRTVAAAMLAIYDEEMMPEILAQLRAAQDPVGVIATISVAVAMRVMEEATSEGVDISGEVMMHAGAEIVSLIAELGQKAGLEIGQKDVERAYYMAMDEGSREATAQGFYTEDAMAEDLAFLQQMTASGDVERITGGKV